MVKAETYNIKLEPGLKHEVDYIFNNTVNSPAYAKRVVYRKHNMNRKELLLWAIRTPDAHPTH